MLRLNSTDGTGAIAAAVATSIPETLVSNVVDNNDVSMLHIGHSAGLIESTALVEKIERKWIARSAFILRTARTLMHGQVVIPNR